jgi:head-tail adaptor
MIQIGELKDRCAFEEPSVTTDSVGQQIESWSLGITRWCNVKEIEAGESDIYDGTEAKESILVTIRGSTSKRSYERMRLTYRGVKWQVKSARQIHDKRFIEMKAELLA